MSLLPVALLLLQSVVAPGGDGEPELELQCEVGPVDRAYGGSAFAIYSCDDGVSVVAVAKRGAAAFPFYFIVTPRGEGVRLYGEGDGDSDASHAAFMELDRFTPADVARLVAATRAVKAG
jgi:hypothetical protein